MSTVRKRGEVSEAARSMAQGISGFSGAALRRTRRQRGLTADQLALRAGVTENTVLRWETGTSRPTAANLRSVTAALDLTPADLLPRRGTIDPNLRDIRELAGHNLETAAAAAGLPRSTLARLERGVQGLTERTADALARLYELPLDEVEAAVAATQSQRVRKAKLP